MITIVGNIKDPQEAELLHRLHEFLYRQPEVQSLGSSWAGDLERIAVKLREPKK